jgi:hypothetical protein
MLKQIVALARSIFHKKAPPIPAAPQEGPDLHLNMYSQPHVLQYMMRVKGMTHDTQALVDINNVRVADRAVLTKDGLGEMKTTIFFCPMQCRDLKIKEIMHEGDGKYIPLEAELNGVKAPKNKASLIDDGLYNLKNVILHSNGKITITPTVKTVWEAVYQ